jgi:hypothetical protein
MICLKCQHDELDVLRTYRGRRRVKEQWIVDENIDTRLIMCQQCRTSYYAESAIISQIIPGRFHGQEEIVFPE